MIWPLSKHHNAGGRACAGRVPHVEGLLSHILLADQHFVQLFASAWKERGSQRAFDGSRFRFLEARV
jgi:hypothetical protein